MIRSTLYSSARPGWSSWDVFSEVAVFSLVLLSVSLALALVSAPNKRSVTDSKIAISASASNLQGVNGVNIDEIGPWVQNGAQAMPYFKSAQAKSEFESALFGRLQRRGIKVCHDATAPKLRLVINYEDQEYAIRGPRNIKNLELELLEDVTLIRSHPRPGRIVTWNFIEAGADSTVADLLPKSTALVEHFADEMVWANSDSERNKKI